MRLDARSKWQTSVRWADDPSQNGIADRSIETSMLQCQMQFLVGCTRDRGHVQEGVESKSQQIQLLSKINYLGAKPLNSRTFTAGTDRHSPASIVNDLQKLTFAR